MHRIAATPGGWDPQTEGVIFIDQTPAPIVFLTAADTDILSLARAVSQLPDGFPALRVANLLHLQQQLTIDTYAERVLQPARAIVLRLLGGRSYWSYGLEVVRETAQRTGAALIVLPGDDRPDPDLISHSTVPLSTVNHLWRYFTFGGVENTLNALQFLARVCLGHQYNPPAPQEVPTVGLYPLPPQTSPAPDTLSPTPKIGILFYRAHYLAGNTAPIDALCQALVDRHLQPVPVFLSSLRDSDVRDELLEYFQPKNSPAIELVLNTTSFAISQPSTSDSTQNPKPPIPNLDVPWLQVIFSSNTAQQWESGFQGLSPRDVAMNVALPEVDGRIISRAVSFKAAQNRHPLLETEVVVYEPVPSRIEFVADLAANWVRLRRTPPKNRRIALILANYPSRNGRLANGVGLDTPASCVAILNALQHAGYRVENPPATGDELIARLTAGVTNDPESCWRGVRQWLSVEEYGDYFASLPVEVRKGIGERWGVFGEGTGEGVFGEGTGETPVLRQEKQKEELTISGIELGNVFVGIQPARGYEVDPSLNYHAPDLEPPHNYLAFYYWLREHFGAQAIVHVGKHGNLEWLPGKSVALSDCCYPEVALGPLPHLYPFIVNDPGEGAQAKRRAQAVIVDHLTPPMTRAELYGPLQQLEGLVDEFYEAESLDPKRLPAIRERIAELVLRENLHEDLGIEKEELQKQKSTILNQIDGYLCELKEAQIRDGLHIFGRCPEGLQLRDLIVAVARHPGAGRLGLTRALAKDWGLEFDPLTADPSQEILDALPKGKSPKDKMRIIGDAISLLEEEAAELVEELMENCNRRCTQINADESVAEKGVAGSATQRELEWIRDWLLPALQQTEGEIAQLLRGLDGCFVPSGPAGAPTRGRPEVLPTGRNFYSVDIRAVPTETAWDVGRKAAEVLVERYAQENGEFPKRLGLSVWGTSAMRTGGDDIAEALALLGVRPVWDGPSRRVVDFEILPVRVLGRPRVDVTLRISGFFRDAFPNLIDLFDAAVAAVAGLDEPAEQNPLAAAVREEAQLWRDAGLDEIPAQLRARYRIFGSKPGAYGAGLQGLIEAQNWTDDEDLARAYINWSSYAYTAFHPSPLMGEGLGVRVGGGVAAPEAFELRLKGMQVVLHNQDNREHDLLDSDDYYQFQGGLTVAVRAITGKNPHTYFGDNSMPENPKVRRLQEEIARVYRSRVVNPKWIAGVMRHGYKGAFEMAATVDYLFAYDATARCVGDFMYEGVAKAYLLEPAVREFIEQKNPWALRDMAERLLEAHQRGLWQSAGVEMVEELRLLVNHAEGIIESAAGL
jgi:cobaltochelatase CobN